MRRSPRLTPTAGDLLVALAVALLAAGCLLALGRTGPVGTGADLTAVVTVDGAEADRFPLQALAEGPRTYSGGGYTLTVEAAPAEDGTPGLRVSRSDCPTQDCVRTGTITRSGQSVICLPARIILHLEGGGEADGGPDVIIG